MKRVPYSELHAVFRRALIRVGFAESPARRCAEVFAEASRDGVDSHGIMRFPRFIRDVKEGRIDPAARAKRVGALGALEQWDGEFGAGPVNALDATDRAIALARELGLGCVALRHTTHWMRGGAYGWRAAEAGFALMAWTNAKPNVPPWGSRAPRLGNNPLVVAVPRARGPLVLDMALSQYSYGKLRLFRHQGDSLSVPGGYDAGDRLTQDPAAILETGRALPIGHWKGAGLALVLDLLAAGLSGGRTTRQIGRQPDPDRGVSQVFLAWDLAGCRDPKAWGREVERVVVDLQSAPPVAPHTEILYPGGRALRCREENDRAGIPVDPRLWSEVLALAD